MPKKPKKQKQASEQTSENKHSENKTAFFTVSAQPIVR